MPPDESLSIKFEFIATKEMRAFAALVRMFYNVKLAEQLETLATDFGAPTAYRVSNVRKYPLVLLVSYYHSLSFSYVLVSAPYYQQPHQPSRAHGQVRAQAAHPREPAASHGRPRC